MDLWDAQLRLSDPCESYIRPDADTGIMPKWLEIKCRDWPTVKRVNKWLSKTPEFSRPGLEDNIVAIMNTTLSPSDVLVAVGTDGILSITPLETGPLAPA